MRRPRRASLCFVVHGALGEHPQAVPQHEEQDRGLRIEDLRKLLGHANIKTTSIYLSTDDSRLEQSIARYADGPLILDHERAA